MRKIFTFLSFFVYSVIVAVAQTNPHDLVFIDKDDYEVADNAIIYCDEQEEDPFIAGEKFIRSNLSVRNKGNQALLTMVKGDVKNITDGFFQICFPSECLTWLSVGKYETPAGYQDDDVYGGESLEAEFITGGNGYATVELQLFTAEINGDSFVPVLPQSKVTLVFNHKATGVAGVVAKDNLRYNVFNAQGLLVRINATSLEGLQKGVYVVKTLNHGKIINTKKYIVK